MGNGREKGDSAFNIGWLGNPGSLPPLGMWTAWNKCTASILQSTVHSCTVVRKIIPYKEGLASSVVDQRRRAADEIKSNENELRCEQYGVVRIAGRLQDPTHASKYGWASRAGRSMR
jgi:hypothetical protein